MNLKNKILSKKAEIGVVGLGYVGLSLSMELVRSGLRVHGIDIDVEKVEQMNRGESTVQDVAGPILKAAVDSGHFRAYQDYEVVSRVDCVIICVPTPLRQTKDPDISYIMDATREIRRYLHNDMLIILESTTYPGTTEEVLSTELQSDRFKVGKDLFLAFSPERADPGNSEFDTKNTPKIVGGITAECTQMAKILYEQIIDQVIPVSSTATAEMVKLLENTFRAVNIGLVNEIAIVCDKLGVSVWEVIEAAATKPFGFMPFYPGPGLGGHCIPIDPLYLSWKLKMLNYNARFIELASEVNTQMPEYCLNRIVRLLNQHQRSVNGTSILILGVTYKRDVNDVRESPALDIVRLLESNGAKVDYSDPYVSCLREDGFVKKSIQLTPETVKQYDLVVLVTDHSCFDYEMIQRSANLIFDTRNSFKEPHAKVSKL
jgi:UDP-N-acetyl-D-glucosamine dehydrogenase